MHTGARDSVTSSTVTEMYRPSPRLLGGMYVCMYVCMYGNVSPLLGGMYVCMYVCMYGNVSPTPPVCMFVCIHACTYAFVHTHTSCRTDIVGVVSLVSREADDS
jgi:hypothetical protein